MANHMSEDEIIRKAAKAFNRLDKLKIEQRQLEDEIRKLCREYDIAMRVWNWQPHMMRQAISARMKKRA